MARGNSYREAGAGGRGARRGLPGLRPGPNGVRRRRQLRRVRAGDLRRGQVPTRVAGAGAAAVDRTSGGAAYADLLSEDCAARSEVQDWLPPMDKDRHITSRRTTTLKANESAG
jgi:hypothetical protein